MSFNIHTDSSENTIDLRDVSERIEELEEQRAEYDEYHNTPGAWALIDDGEPQELALLVALMDDLAGCGGDHDWRGDWYPLTLIRDSYFVDAMRELCEDIGDFPNGVPSYYVIDWDATADNLRVDYSSVEFEGATYWYR